MKTKCERNTKTLEKIKYWMSVSCKFPCYKNDTYMDTVLNDIST